MKRIGIMGAMALEVNKIIKHMDIRKESVSAGSKFYIGRLHDKEVVVTCCGVGKVNAASSTQIMISEYQVDAIINTGIGGGMHRDVKVCDLVVSRNVTHHDVRPDQMASCYPFERHFEADQRLIDAAKASLEASEDLKNKYHVGRIVSGEAFINDKEVKNRIIDTFKPHCVEMEGSAIGHVAFLNRIPFIVIRSISDNADEGATMSYEAFESIAAEQSSTVVMDMIKRL